MAILNTEVKTVGEFLKNIELTIPIYQREKCGTINRRYTTFQN